MLSFLSAHLQDILIFLGALAGGAIGGGIAVRISLNRSMIASGNSHIADQSGANAGGDVVGRDKRG
jgi:hypothetical protein